MTTHRHVNKRALDLKPLDNLTATVAPAVTDDASKGYAFGSRWVNTLTRNHYVCVSAAVGAAVWQLQADGGPGGQERFVDGAPVFWVSVSSVKAGMVGLTSFVRDSTGASTISFSGELTASLATSGAGGLDTGAEAASTWYAVHVIGSSTGSPAPALMFSTSMLAPTLPAGYDLFRRVAWARNNASSDLLKFTQLGVLRNRFTFYEEESVALRFLNAQNATVFTSVDASSLAPPFVRFVGVRMDYTPQTAGNAAFLRATGSTVTDTFIQLVGVTANKQVAAFSDVILDAARFLDYKVQNSLDALSLYLGRYSEQL